MKKIFIFFLLLLTTGVYSNPKLPSFTLNEFGFTDKGWVIELKSAYFPGSIQIISDTDTSDFFPIYINIDSMICIITNGNLQKKVHINPLGDNIVIRDPNNWCVVWFSFGSKGGGIQRIVPKVNQSFSVWHKPLGKTFFYLDNSPTFGLPNDSIGAIGTLNGIIIDTLGNPIPNLKVYYDYETYYGGGDIYTTTDDSGHFCITNFAECLTLKFKNRYFYDDKVNVLLYPDSTTNISIVIKTDILSGVEPGYVLAGFNLEQNFPNPFNPTTKIKYSIPTSPQPSPYKGEGARVRLKVYDILGNEVATLVDEEQPAGEYEVEFSTKGGSAYGGNGYSLTSGIYFYQLKVGIFIDTKKLCILK